MVRRFAASVAEVAEQVDRELSRQGSPSPAVAGGDAP
jgi:hypothetical protein